MFSLAFFSSFFFFSSLCSLFSLFPFWQGREHILAHFSASKPYSSVVQFENPSFLRRKRAGGGRAAGGKATNISMHLRAGGGRHNDPHLNASAGGRRAERKTEGKNQGIANEHATHRSNEKPLKKQRKPNKINDFGALPGSIFASWGVLGAS